MRRVDVIRPGRCELPWVGAEYIAGCSKAERVFTEAWEQARGNAWMNGFVRCSAAGVGPGCRCVREEERQAWSQTGR